ncbi:MAG: hypothetical protein Kow002_21040 [Anaerolineales bacterium]
MRLLKQLAVVFAVLVVLTGTIMLFTYDIIKLEWVVFMEVQESFGAAEDPLPLPARSIPVDGAAYLVDRAGNPIAPQNPVPADEFSIARGRTFYEYNCLMCHGETGAGNGPIGVFLLEKKPVDLSSALVQEQSDGDIFLTLTNGKGMMPNMRENLTIRDRWDVVNYIRTLQTSAEGDAQ